MFTRCSKIPTGLQLALGPCQMRCQNPSKNEDKEYQVTILCDAQGDYYVFSAWGRWRSTLDGQVKEKTQSAARAVAVANEWMRKKGAKGYQEYSSNYLGTGGFSAQALIAATPQTPVATPPKPRGITPVRPSAPAAAASFDNKKWRQFVKTMGATTITVQKYYFDQPPAQVGTKEYERLMRELFLDAVEAGALQLPPHVKKEDFDFQFTASHSYSSANTLSVVYKPSAETQNVHCPASSFLSEKIRLSDYRVGNTLNRICARCIATMQL